MTVPGGRNSRLSQHHHHDPAQGIKQTKIICTRLALWACLRNGSTRAAGNQAERANRASTIKLVRAACARNEREREQRETGHQRNDEAIIGCCCQSLSRLVARLCADAVPWRWRGVENIIDKYQREAVSIDA